MRFVRSGHAEQVKGLRELLDAGDRNGYDREKRGLPAFTMSAACSDRTRLVSHSGLVQVDLDKLNGTLFEIRDKVKSDPHVAGGFVSPSGTGLKLAVRVPANPAGHIESFQAAERYFLETYGVEIDRACKDPLRLCFVSFDPDAWINKNATELDIQKWRPLPAPGVENPSPPSISSSEIPEATDLGRALRFIERFGNDIRYVHEWNRWLVFEDGRWNIDGNGAAHRLSAELCKEAVARALTLPGENERSSALRGATAWGNVRTVDDMLAAARNDSRVIVRPEQLDADPWLVGARNGVVDLRTGIITEHSREQLVTKFVGADFDHTAKCPRWERFLEEVFADEAVRRFVWKVAGYSLSGHTTEHLFMFLHGRGANGKSTLLEILNAAFGDYAIRAGARLLYDIDRRGAPPDHQIAELLGRRLVVANETLEGGKLNEGAIKDITGGDTLRGERKYEAGFSFRPTAKIWLAGNHKPTIRGTDDGIWRRVRLIPFERQFGPEERDENLHSKLLAELPGILNWLVEGAILWQMEGLTPPPIVQEAVADYRSEQDTLADFLDECISHEDAGATLPHSHLYAAYREWATGHTFLLEGEPAPPLAPQPRKLLSHWDATTGTQRS
jgi:putative DNA primase/helicase